LKIALVVQADTMGIGGLLVSVKGFYAVMTEAGHDVTIVSLGPGRGWAQLAAPRVKGVCFEICGHENNVLYVRRLTRHFIEEAYDVLFLNVGGKLIPAIMSLPFLPDSTAVVLVVHGDRPWIYTLAKLNAGAWNCAVTISPKVQQTLAAQIPDKPLILISNGVALPGETELRTRAAWETPVRLLFVGRMVRIKGILLLPAILAACFKTGVPARLTIVGVGSDSGALDQAIDETGTRDQIDLWGARSSQEVYAAMRTHHILLMPSQSEGFGLVLAEAQANGCVPIATRLPGVTDYVVEDGVTGLLADDGDAASFARQVAALHEPARWRSFSQAGIRRARTLFSLETLGVRCSALLDELRLGAYPLTQPRATLRRKWKARLTWRDWAPVALLPHMERWLLRIPRWLRRIPRRLRKAAARLLLPPSRVSS
jgi:glycosyltransferase involved in cell wall biosynthesis